MRPPLLSAGVIVTLATIAASAFAQGRPATPPSANAPGQTPSAAPPGGPPPAPGAQAPPPASAAPPSSSAPAPPGMPPSAPSPGTSPPGPAPSSAPVPGAPGGAPPGTPGAAPPPGTSPGPQPPGQPPAQPPVYGPPPGYPQPGYGQPGYPQPGYAQPGYPQPYYPAPYPGAPAAPPDAHSHTGFFLRMGIGGGYLASTSTYEGATFPGKVDAAGGAFALEISIGGALSPGIILAGSFTTHTVGNAKLTNDTRTYKPAHDPSVNMLAAMIDVYPNPKAGFHVGGALGFATYNVREDTDAQASETGQSGLGIAPHVGYEWWVGNYWGIGVLGRFIFARTQGDYAADGKEKDTVTGGSVMFSATYN